MKKLTLLTLVAATAVTSFGQGFLDWGNNFTGNSRMPIYGPQAADAGISLAGQSSLGVPAGATAYTGALLQGAGYTFAIYAGPLGSTADQLTLLVSSAFRTSANPASLPAGLVLGGTTQVPGVLPGVAATFQVRAWDNAGGATYATAAIKGASGLIQTGLLGGIDAGGGIVANPSTVGWNSFNIYAVPEPSTIVLAGLGAASLLIFRRRK